MKYLVQFLIGVIAFLLFGWLGYGVDKWFFHLLVDGTTISQGIRLVIKLAIVITSFSTIAAGAIYAGIFAGTIAGAFFKR